MTLAVRQVQVPREHRRVPTGQAVRMTIQLVDHVTASPLVTAEESPMLSLFNPSGTLLLNDVSMDTVSPGVYSYTYQTTAASPVGLYTANFTALYGGYYARVERIHVFTVVVGSDFADLSYLLIKDQTGVIWYWWLLADGSIETQLVPPAYAIKENIALNSIIPYWLVIVSDTAATRYVYPDVAGDILVSDTAPAVGPGTSTTYTFVSYGGKSYLLKVDAADNLYSDEI